MISMYKYVVDSSISTSHIVNQAVYMASALQSMILEIIEDIPLDHQWRFKSTSYISAASLYVQLQTGRLPAVFMYS